MLVPNRYGSSDFYRYGFNGKEKDDEIKGSGVQYDYGFRIYDARIGKFLSVDPLAQNYPHYTPYQFAGNKPIKFIDLDGAEEFPHGNDWSLSDIFEFFFGVTSPKETINNSSTIEGKERNERNIQRQKIVKVYTAKLEKYKQTTMEVGDYVLPIELINQISTGKNLDGTEATPSQVVFNILTIIPVGKGTKAGKYIVKHGDEFLDVSKDVISFVKKHNPCGCFTAGTEVFTDKGYKKIEDIVVGDLVWAYNDKTLKKSLKKVLNTIVLKRDHIYKIYFEEKIIEVTNDHPFFVSNRWVKAEDLVRGNMLTLDSGNKIIIDKIERIEGNYEVFNFEVEDYHTYYVTNRNVLVHNSGPCDWIKGFKSFGHFKQFGTQLQAGLAKAGFKDVKLYMQGSAAKGVSHKGVPFGPHSDFDVALVGNDLFDKATELGIVNHISSGPIEAGSKIAKALGIDDLLKNLSKKYGREVNVKIYKTVEEAKLKDVSVRIPTKNGG